MQKIQKRDGRVVDFDSSKITNAIFKATEAVGEPNFDLAKNLAETVFNKVQETFNPEATVKVEQIQDIVEQILVEEGQAKVAKAYILYRQKRTEIRRQKQQVLQKTEIDEVDKKFDLNALKVLVSRYLRKDIQGNIIETPRELFIRVAIHVGLPSVLYDERIFQKSGKNNFHKVDDINFKAAAENQKLKIGRFILNEFHLEGLKRLYDRLNHEGKIKTNFSNILKMLEKGEFDNYEQEIEDYYNVMVERKFLPNTPALANFGNLLGMGSACFVVDVGDSIEEIMEALKQAAIIFKSGGGVGYNFSKLRPEGDFVRSTCGSSSGPLVFMSLFDKMTDVIKQGGIRRGASMGILNIDHPNIEQFIVAKRGNQALRNFNISVFVKSDFWDYYEQKKPYPLRNPKNGEIVKYVDPQNLFSLIIYQAWESAEPGMVFDDKVNEFNPFLKSLGPIECTNPCVVGDTLVAVADGRNYVPIRQLAEEKKDVPVYSFGDGKVQIRMARNPRKTRTNASVWKVVLDDGSYIIATEDHKFRDRDNNEIKLRDLKPGTSLMPFYKFQYRSIHKRTDYWGIVQNNGSRARAEHRMIPEFYLNRLINGYPEEIVHHKNFNGLDNSLGNLEILDHKEHSRLHQIGERNVMKGKWWSKLSEVQKEAYRQRMSQAVSGENNGMYGRHHKKTTKAFLSQQKKDYFSNRENRDRFSKIIRQVYQLHPEIREKISQAKTFYPEISDFCLVCSKEIIYKEYAPRLFCSRSCASIFINRHRDTTNVKNTKAKKRAQLRKELYNLGVKFLQANQQLPNYKEFKEFAAQNGYSGDVRSTFGGFINFKEELSLHNHKVISVEFYGYEDVFNITVDEFHTVAYITNPNNTTKITKKPLLSGIITSNCGEVPLYPAESCNLGSINIWSFCQSKPTNGRKKEVEFDWQGFEKTIKLATRFLDNVSDINKYPLSDIEEATLNTRRIGLGIMGLADAMYELELSYNSTKGLEFMERVMEFLNYHSKLISIDLAQERGSFPYYDKSFYDEGRLPFRGKEKEGGELPLEEAEKSEFNLDWEALKEKIKKHGLRNSQTTTNAPTGSISMIAGCSSGIEPNFSLVFEKKVAIGTFYYVNPVFEKVMAREGLLDEDLIREVCDRNGSIQELTYIPPKMKKVFVAAMDFTAKDHIKALAALQKWTDSAISKTINFPSSATVEDMKEAYLLAYKLNCKGVTAFRDKSIIGVLSAGARAEKKPKTEGELVSMKDEKASGPVIYHDISIEQAPPIKYELNDNGNGESCPKCAAVLVKKEGCKSCPQCGWGVCTG